MTQYIDKDAILAEIDRQKIGYNEDGKHSVEYDITKKIIDIINAIEVKEVDLEKHLKEDIEDVLFDLDGVAVKGTTSYITVEDVKYIAKRFFELGLNTKQTSEEIKIGETKICLKDDGGEPPYDGKQWLDLSCTEYEIPKDTFKDGDDVELIIRKKQKGK